MITKYLLLLGIGHLLGDFYFQNEKLAKYKDKTFKGVLLHSLEYYVSFLLVILPVLGLDMVLAATYASLTHLVIDTVKYELLIKKKIKKSCKVFVADQCAHTISIFALAYIINGWNFTISPIGIVTDILNPFGYSTEIIARWIFSVLLIHIPTNIFLQLFLEDYKPKNNESIIKADYKAGRRIGTIERLIMLIFLSMNQYSAMGFVLTAKSIARYDKITKDEKFAEYYLLGTLLSTLCVIMCRMLIIK